MVEEKAINDFLIAKAHMEIFFNEIVAYFLCRRHFEL